MYMYKKKFLLIRYDFIVIIINMAMLMLMTIILYIIKNNNNDDNNLVGHSQLWHIECFHNPFLLALIEAKT